MDALGDFYLRTPETGRATTIPASWYLDPAMLARERERIFSRSWHWAGRAEDVARPGDSFTCDVLGEPLVVVRGDDDELRALHNVCRHRAGPVACGKESRKQLQCRYHGWTYGLDGKLRRAPEMEGVEGFSTAEVALAAAGVEEWPPLVFVHLGEGATSFRETTPRIPAEVARAGFPIEKMRAVERREYLVECNWKVYVDNYLEGYHIPMIHPALFREVDYERYRVETHRFHSRQLAPLRSGGGGDRDRTYPAGRGADEALYYWVFPNLMLNFYPGNLQVNAVVPIDVGRTLTIFEWYGLPSEDLSAAIAFSDQVQREDMSICRDVQRGLASRSYDRGRLSARRENGVHHFHLLLDELLARENPHPGAE
jgi:phenylpropionate dioxygenase-like ring-hydroxylating dioxygenase large terminal subunit